MTMLERARKKLIQIVNKPRNLSLPPTTLATAESLTVPPVQVIVLTADMGCFDCQKRVADVISRLDETTSMLVDVLEKKVVLTGRAAAAKGSNKLVSVKKKSLFLPQS